MAEKQPSKKVAGTWRSKLAAMCPPPPSTAQLAAMCPPPPPPARLTAGAQGLRAKEDRRFELYRAYLAQGLGPEEAAEAANRALDAFVREPEGRKA